MDTDTKDKASTTPPATTATVDRSVDPNRVYTLKELAELLSLTKRTVVRYLQNGQLNGRKVGHVWRVTGDAILYFIGKGGATSDQPPTPPPAPARPEQNLRQQTSGTAGTAAATSISTATKAAGTAATETPAKRVITREEYDAMTEEQVAALARDDSIDWEHFPTKFREVVAPKIPGMGQKYSGNEGTKHWEIETGALMTHNNLPPEYYGYTKAPDYAARDAKREQWEREAREHANDTGWAANNNHTIYTCKY